jgi:hypothetical protein
MFQSELIIMDGLSFPLFVTWGTVDFVLLAPAVL